MTWGKYYHEWIRRAFSKTFSIAESISFLFSILGGYYSYYHPSSSNTINSLLWIIPSVLLISLIIISLLRSPYIMYKEIINSKSDEYYKYNDNAKIDRLHRIFCTLYKDGKFEENTCLERMTRWEEELQRVLIDNFPGEIIRRYRLNIRMITGPNDESTAKKRFEWAMDFVKDQLNSDFQGTLTPL